MKVNANWLPSPLVEGKENKSSLQNGYGKAPGYTVARNGAKVFLLKTEKKAGENFTELLKREFYATKVVDEPEFIVHDSVLPLKHESLAMLNPKFIDHDERKVVSFLNEYWA